MRAVAAAIDRARFRVESRLVNEAGAGGIGPASGPGFQQTGRESFSLPAPEFCRWVVQTVGPLNQIGHATGGKQGAGGIAAADTDILRIHDFAAFGAVRHAFCINAETDIGDPATAATIARRSSRLSAR